MDLLEIDNMRRTAQGMIAVLREKGFHDHAIMLERWLAKLNWPSDESKSLDTCAHTLEVEFSSLTERFRVLRLAFLAHQYRCMVEVCTRRIKHFEGLAEGRSPNDHDAERAHATVGSTRDCLLQAEASLKEILTELESNADHP